MIELFMLVFASKTNVYKKKKVRGRAIICL